MVYRLASLFILCGLIIICLAATTLKPKARSGPYMSTAVNIKQCENPSPPYVKDPVVVFKLENTNILKKSLPIVRGNVTILKETRDVKTSVKEFYYEDGKWQMTFIIRNLSCRSALISLLMEAFNIMYEKKTCTVPRGTYIFEVNYNNIDHLWMATREYGRLLRRIEASSKNGTVMCVEYESTIAPLAH